MPRAKRKIIQNVTYHTWSKCHNSLPMFTNDLYREILAQVIRKTQSKYHFKLIDYDISDDELHIVIKTMKQGTEISRIMQYIKARFAEIYNRLHKRTGSFWNERYRDRIIEESQDPQSAMLGLHWLFTKKQSMRKSLNKTKTSIYGGMMVYFEGKQFNNLPTVTFSQAFLNLGENHTQRIERFLQKIPYPLESDPNFIF